MVDIFFSKTKNHKQNLIKHQDKVIFCNEIFRVKLVLQDVVQAKNIQVRELPNYSFFKNIKLEHIIALRLDLDITNDVHQFWCEKIHRFLEFHSRNIERKIKINYAHKKDRVIFVQNLIALLLVYYNRTKDLRFLSLALKLLRINSLTGRSFLRKKYNPHYSYNMLVANEIVKNI